jgi:hypothetical protein
MQLPGLTRHLGTQPPEEKKLLAACKVPMCQHLQALSDEGKMLFHANGKPARRVIAIGSRNVGNNHGYVAWERDQTPRLFMCEASHSAILPTPASHRIRS